MARMPLRIGLAGLGIHGSRYAEHLLRGDVPRAALAAVSLAVQAQVDVKRADKLAGPSSLFVLNIAESGERKTTCDGFFTAAIEQYEQEQRKRPVITQHKAAVDAWGSKRNGLLDLIRAEAKRGGGTSSSSDT